MTVYRSRAFQSAYDKGAAVARDGKPRKVNPYEDHRTYRGAVTFSRAFFRAWDAGWLSVRGES